jgi:acyl-coenzyme A synthetase/AMP-(fatty) acid ligase
MAYYKAPGWVAFVEDLPVTATEKLQRGEIRARVADVMAKGHAYDTRPLKVRR